MNEDFRDYQTNIKTELKPNLAVTTQVKVTRRPFIRRPTARMSKDVGGSPSEQVLTSLEGASLNMSREAKTNTIESITFPQIFQ